MKCSEFLEKFSEFQDAQKDSPKKKEGEKHLLVCEKCTHYTAVVSMGVGILQEIPPAGLSENFWASLEHRIFHIRDEKILGGNHLTLLARSCVIVCALVSFIVLLKNSAVFSNAGQDVDLPAIVVSSPPLRQQLIIPRSSLDIFEQPSSSKFVYWFWSDINGLMYEYSTMGERYRASSVLRQADLVEYK